jgi:hypothetical protein
MQIDGDVNEPARAIAEFPNSIRIELENSFQVSISFDSTDAANE